MYNELQLAKGVAMMAAIVAKKANTSVAHQKCMLGLNNVSNLSGRVGDSERMVGYLQKMLRELGELMMGIVGGSIPVADCHGSWKLGNCGNSEPCGL